MLMSKVCAAEVSTPPFAVPPLSCAATETCTVAVPCAFAAGVKVSVPLGGDGRLRAEGRVVVVADQEVRRSAPTRSSGRR